MSHHIKSERSRRPRYLQLSIALLLFLAFLPAGLSATKVYFNDTFDTDKGWSGGTYDSTNKWYDTTSGWGTWTSPDLDISNFTWVRACMKIYLESSQQYNKYYIGETTGSTSDPHVLIDSGFVTKPEPGYFPDYTGSYGAFRDICIEMNESNEKLEFFYGGTSRWSYTGTAFDWSGEDYLRIAVGDLNGGTEYRIDDVTVEALCDELPSGACDEGGGSNTSFVNATYFYNESETPFTVTGTTYVEGTRVTFTSVNGATYLVTGYAEGLLNTTAYALRARFLQNATVLSLDQDLPGVAGLTAGDRTPFYFAYLYTGNGQSVRFAWDFSGSNAASQANITRSYIQVVRLDDLPNASYNSSYTATTVSNVNNVWGDAAGDTDRIQITPATSGRYLFIARATANSDSTSSSFAYRAFLTPSTDASTLEFIPYLIGTEGSWSFDRREDRTTAEETVIAAIAVRTLTGGTTYNWTHQIADIDTTASSDWKYRSIVAVRLDDVFANVTSSNATGELSTTSTTFQNATSITLGGESGDFLTFAATHTRLSSTSVDFETQTVYNGIPYNLRVHRPKDVANIVGYGVSKIFTKDNNDAVITQQYRRQDASGTVYTKNNELVAFRLGWYNITGGGGGGSDPCACAGTENCVLNTATCTATNQTINVGGYNLTIQGGGFFSVNHNVSNAMWCFVMGTQVVVNASRASLRCGG